MTNDPVRGSPSLALVLEATGWVLTTERKESASGIGDLMPKSLPRLLGDVVVDSNADVEGKFCVVRLAQQPNNIKTYCFMM